jgi:hypothetical protein
MSAYNSESALARLLRPHYSRSQDEGRALLREAFTLSGDLQINGTTLHVRLDPASAPRRSKALASLCTELTDTATRYPGTPDPRLQHQRPPRRYLNELTMSGDLDSEIPTLLSSSPASGTPAKEKRDYAKETEEQAGIVRMQSLTLSRAPTSCPSTPIDRSPCPLPLPIVR